MSPGRAKVQSACTTICKHDLVFKFITFKIITLIGIVQWYHACHNKLKLVVFSVAERLLAKPQLKFEDTTLHVSTHQPTVTKPADVKLTSKSEQVMDQQHINPEKSATSPSGSEGDLVLEIQGIPLQTSRQMVELFFENARKSGGGDIKQLNYDSDGHALISLRLMNILIKPTFVVCTFLCI